MLNAFQTFLQDKKAIKTKGFFRLVKLGVETEAKMREALRLRHRWRT